jgi:hypothetical protein
MATGDQEIVARADFPMMPLNRLLDAVGGKTYLHNLQ